MSSVLLVSQSAEYLNVALKTSQPCVVITSGHGHLARANVSQANFISHGAVQHSFAATTLHGDGLVFRVDKRDLHAEASRGRQV